MRTGPETKERHGMHGTSTYMSWRSMIQRCTYPSSAGWERYGALGVTVCDRWRWSFTAFLEDMGERPDGKTLDRIDNSMGYEPSNCRWATLREQLANRRPRRSYLTKLSYLEVREIRALLAEGLTRSQISELYGVSKTAITNISTGKTWKVEWGADGAPSG